MKKLGIFGDSWFDPTHGHNSAPELEKYAWMYLLEEYDVTTFGKNASGIYYSYKKFLDNHDKFDRVIFGVTISTRWGNGFTVHGKERHFNNYTIVDQFLNNPDFHLNSLSPQLTKELEALRDYYYYLVDIEYSDTMKYLMVEDIKKIRPDAVIMDIHENPIQHYYNLQAKSLNVPTLAGAGEIRCVCHLTPELNQALAYNVSNMLINGSWGELPSQVDIAHDFNYYYLGYDDVLKNQR